MRLVAGCLLLITAALVVGCSGEISKPDTSLRLSSITIDGGARAIERGTEVTLTATALDTADKPVTIPVVWRSSAANIASFGHDVGVLTANDTGSTFITASALGITSQSVEVRVIWVGAAKITPFQFNPPQAITPGVVFDDSVRFAVANLAGGAAPGGLVTFSTTGGGSVSPTVATVGPTGIASTQWTLGSTAGKNTLVATVVKDDSTTAVPWVESNPATVSVTSYAALTAVRGDGQTGSVLSPLPVSPAVKLVDASGNPRAGVPVTFTPSGSGRVAASVVSTGSDGVASPGVWTLGDAPGDQQLTAKIEAAQFVFHATGTGQAVHFIATRIAAAQSGTCAITSDGFVSCFGQAPQNGTGDMANVSTPTLTKGGVHMTSIVGGGAHFCGTTSDLAIYCWGVNPPVDASGGQPMVYAPTRLPGSTAWTQVTVGAQHNCALASDQSAFCWGSDANGQLGDNQSATKSVPQAVSGGFSFTTLAAGSAHECGLVADGSAFCWGSNSSGQLGDGSTTDRGAPTSVSGGNKFTAIGGGANWTCGLLADGHAACWGGGTGHFTPDAYATAPMFSSLSVGAGHACALTSDGTAYCWGDNTGGQLGDGTTAGRNTPTLVSGDLRFASIAAGFQHTCGITLDGSVACWGKNQFGEVGISQLTNQLTPRYVVLGVNP